MRVMLIRYHPMETINTEVPSSLMDEVGVVPPLGLAYIASVLEQHGHQVSILDCEALNLTKEQTVEGIRLFKPDIVGITAMSTTIRGALAAARMAKQCNTTVVMGGPHMSAYPKEVLSYDFVDYGVIGEGEYPMLNLVNALQNREEVAKIKGLVYKEHRNVVVNTPDFVKDIDALPYPARHLLPIEKYKVIIALHPMTTMISSRGCPFPCGYCSKDANHHRYRVRDPKKIVDEMEYVIKKYKVKEIVVVDDTLTLRRDNVIEMCMEIIRRNIKVKWESPTRVDCVDQELLNMMYRAGCRRLRYGVESGDPDILKLMKKGITLEQVENAFRWTKKAGIEAFAYFIIGYMHETPETIKKTIKFAKRIKADMVMFSVATPLPCSELYTTAMKEGYIKGDYWAEYTLGLRSDRLPYLVKDADRWVMKAYRSFYLRPSYVLRRMLKIRTFDDVSKSLNAGKGLFKFRMVD